MTTFPVGRTAAVAHMRADARLTQRDALLELCSVLRLPYEVDDDGSEYLRSTSDTTLDVRVDEHDLDFPIVLTVWHWKGETEARIVLGELREQITRATGWTIIASE